METNCQIHDPAALLPVKRAPVAISYVMGGGRGTRDSLYTL